MAEPIISKAQAEAKKIRENPDYLLNGLPKPSLLQSAFAGLQSGLAIPTDTYSSPGLSALRGLSAGYGAYQNIAPTPQPVQPTIGQISPRLAQERPELADLTIAQYGGLKDLFASQKQPDVLDQTDMPFIVDTLRNKGYTETESNQYAMSMLGQPWKAMSLIKPKSIAKPTIAQTTVDRLFAKTYEDYVGQGGYSDVISQISSLEDVKSQLESGKNNLTGPAIGNVPLSVRSLTNAKSVEVQQQAEQTIQRTLRSTLGAQFTEKEGILFMKRGYDPTLRESINAKKIGNMINKLRIAAEAKQAAVNYYEANGTLVGYKGKIYRLNSSGEMITMTPTQESISAPKIDIKNASIDDILRAAEGE